MVLESKGHGVIEQGSWCYRARVMVLWSNGHGVIEQGSSCYGVTVTVLERKSYGVQVEKDYVQREVPNTCVRYCCYTVVKLLLHCCYTIERR
jgi:hypothetical protein